MGIAIYFKWFLSLFRLIFLPLSHRLLSFPDWPSEWALDKTRCKYPTHTHIHTHMKSWDYQAALCVVRVSESVYRCEFQALGLVTSPRRPMRSLRGANTHTHAHIMAPSCTLLSIVLVFTPLNPLTHTHRAILQVRRLLIPERLHVTDVALTASVSSTQKV